MDERNAEIISEAKAIITTIEEWSLPLSRIAVRARRLAHTLDDDTAIMWLTLECSGIASPLAPERPWKVESQVKKGFKKALKLRSIPDFANLTTSQIVSAVVAGKTLNRTSIAGASLAELELAFEKPSKEELTEMNETGLGNGVMKITAVQIEQRAIYNRVADAIHEWATGVYIAHKFHALAGNIFEQLKISTDAILTEICPNALNKLTHAIEQANTENPEAWSSAAMSCRRVLKDFADAVYPAKAEKADGRDVTDDKYINRLYAFAKERGGDTLASEELDGLGITLTRMQSLSSKGVHTAITREEAHAVILRTYMLLSRLARLAKPAK